MSEQEMKFTEEELKQAIKEGNIETIEKFVNLPGEDILSQLGVKGQYDDLLKAAVEKGDLKMVKTLLKRSNLIQASMDNFIDGLDESVSEKIKDELREIADWEKRSNLQILEQKRQEKEDLEAFVSGGEEEESSNDTHEEVSFIEQPSVSEKQVENKESKEEMKTRVENKVPLWMSTGMFPNFEQKKETNETSDVSPVAKEEQVENKEDAQPKQNQGEKDMPTNKTDYYYTDPELETADYLAEHASVDIKKEKKAGPELKVTDDMVFADPDLESVENEVKTTSADTQKAKPAENVQSAVKNTFRDLNNLDAHMPIGQVLARLEDVEFKENETQKKELFDEIKRQYQLKRENPDYKVQGLNGRINSTDMLKFAQHIDNVIDDGEPDNIDYTQGHTEKIRSLATLDRHLQISEVLARLEDVAAKTQDPNEQALLDLVREGYEEKRKSPENDLSGLNSFVDSTAALNLAKRIDLAIDDGEIENVDCLIMDTVQVNDSEKAEEKNIVQDNVQESTSKTPQKENLPPNKFQRINIDPNDLPTPEEAPVSTESTVEDEVVPSEKSNGEEPFSVDVGVAETAEEEKPFTVGGPEATGSEAETDERISATVGAAETEKESEGMKNGPGFWANWHKYPNYKFMSTDEGKSFSARPYYFNPSKLTEEEKELARHMLAKAGVKIDEVEAPLDFKKGPVPMQEGDDVWRVTGSKNIKKLKKFLNECQENEDKALGKDLTPAKSEDEKSVDWKGGAKKVGKFIKGVGSGIKKIGKLDSVKSINAAMDKFNESVFKTGLDSPEEFGSNMLIAIMAFPFDFLDIYLKTKAEKYADSGDSKDSDKKVPSMEDDRKKQHEALKKIMNKMVEKDPDLFRELAENGIFGDGRDGISQEERAENAKQFFMKPENEELMNRLKGAFAEVAKEKPGWIHAIYPSDYKGPVTPDVLLNHVMGWGNSPVAGADRTVVPPTADRTVVPPTGPALSPEMQAIMQQMQLLTAEIQGLREEVAQLRQENAQLKEQMNQQQAENAQLKAELEAYRSGKVKPGAEVSPSDGIVPPVAPKTEKREIPDLEYGPSFMNNRSMTNAILEDELKGYKEAKEIENPEPGSREEFLKKVAEAYQYGGKIEGLNDLIKSDKELKWAEEIASTVENGGEDGNGKNFPRITKEITVRESDEKEDPQPAPTPEPTPGPAPQPAPTPGPTPKPVPKPKPAPRKKEGNKKVKELERKIKELQEELKKVKEGQNVTVNVINNNNNSADADSRLVSIQSQVNKVTQEAIPHIRQEKQQLTTEKMENLTKHAKSISEEETKLSEAQEKLRSEHPEIFEKFTLNDQGKPVNKEGEIVKADEIRKELGLTKERDAKLREAATQRGMIAILKAGNEAGYKATEAGQGIHADKYRQKPSSGKEGATNQAQKKAKSMEQKSAGR